MTQTTSPAARRETLRQYTDRRVREIATKYGETQTEIRGLYDWENEWWCQIKTDARNGAVIDARTLDAVSSAQRYHITHDYPASVPAGYINPDSRAA